MKDKGRTMWWVAVLVGLLALVVVAARPYDPGNPAGTREGTRRGFQVCRAYRADKRQADALGVTVDQLREARHQTALERIQEALDAGRITQEQYENAVTWSKFRFRYLHPEQLAAKALGMSLDDLRRACEEGKTLKDLLEAKGLDARAFRQALEDAATQQVLQALEDGVLDTEDLARVLVRWQLRGWQRAHGQPGPGHGPSGQP